MNRDEILQEIEQLRQRLAQLEAKLQEPTPQEQVWPPPGYYTAYHVLSGMVLGMAGSAASLLLNIVGSLVVGQAPLKLIQVYLTFPLGETALQTESSLALAIGCCLYLGTGMLLGIPFQLVLTRCLSHARWLPRFLVVSLLSLLLWLVNFYGILSWLQPALFGGKWIVQQIPWSVAALTHLVFGWTLVLLQPWGTFVPYSAQAEGK